MDLIEVFLSIQHTAKLITHPCQHAIVFHYSPSLNFNVLQTVLILQMFFHINSIINCSVTIGIDPNSHNMQVL